MTLLQLRKGGSGCWGRRGRMAGFVVAAGSREKGNDLVAAPDEEREKNP